MAAARQVLELPELLENIIIQLPAHQIYTLKRVSKFWGQLIRSSPAIRKASCLHPSRYSPYGTPIYSCTTKSSIGIHPCIKGSWSFTNEGTTYTRFYVDRSSREAVQKFKDESAILPRCQALLVQAYHPIVYTMFTGCVLYARDGIKIEDLLDVRERMKTTFARFDPQEEERDCLDCKMRILVTFCRTIPHASN